MLLLLLLLQSRCNPNQLFLVRVLGTSWYWARGVFYW
jgi:hypothetical protein